MSNKNKKQFQLDNKENCIIYLCRIISSCELCMDRYKVYNKETKEVLSRYQKGDKIPYEIYVCNVLFTKSIRRLPIKFNIIF